MSEPLVDLKTAIENALIYRPNKQWPVYGQEGNLDRSKYVTASEIGYCERKIKFDKIALQGDSYNPEDGTGMLIDWGYAERGNNIEDWVVRLLRSQFNNLHYTGDEQVSFIADVQSGTPDGVFLFDDHGYILEVKSIDPRTNWAKLPKKAHVDQVTQNADLVSHNLNHSPSGGVLLYIDASNYQRVKPFHIEFSQDEAESLQVRAERIMEASGPEELSPEGMFNDGCKMCAHTAACSKVQMELRNKGTGNDEIRKAKANFFPG